MPLPKGYTPRELFSLKKPQYCEPCKYGTDDICNFDRHKRTKKHLKNLGIHNREEFTEIRPKPAKKPKVKKLHRHLQEIKLSDGEEAFLLPCYDRSQTDSLYVCGPRGCGKSVFSSGYTEDYLTKNKGSRFFLFSNKAEDEVLDKLSPVRVELNQDLVDAPVDLHDYENSICLFDDIDAIADKNIKKAVFNIYNLALKDGRSLGITPIITYHNATDFRATRDMLNNSSICVVFPKSGATQQIEYMLKTYVGLSRAQVRQILKLDSRWVAIRKTAPLCILYSKGIYLLQNE